MANEPILCTRVGLFDSLIDDERDVEKDVEKDDEHDKPANFNTTLFVPNPGSEHVEGVGCEQNHALVDEFLPIDEQGLIWTISPQVRYNDQRRRELTQDLSVL